MGRFSDFFTDLVEPTPEQEPAPVVEVVSEPTPVGYNPDARDGDNDGIVQEDTPFERPAPAKTTRKRTK